MTSCPQTPGVALDEYKKLAEALEQLKKQEKEIRSKIDLWWHRMLPEEREEILEQEKILMRKHGYCHCP